MRLRSGPAASTAPWGLLLITALCGCSRTEVVAAFPESFAGVGLELKVEGGHPIVVRPLPEGPAAQAGLLAGDPILAVDGVPTRGMSLGDVVMRLRGPPESQVTLAVERKGTRILFVVVRRTMQRGGKGYKSADR